MLQVTHPYRFIIYYDSDEIVLPLGMTSLVASRVRQRCNHSGWGQRSNKHLVGEDLKFIHKKSDLLGAATSSCEDEHPHLAGFFLLQTF